MQEWVGKLVLRALGLLLLTAAVLKGYELLTTPVANADIWSNRYFLIFQVEFELALGIWLLSGLFKRAAWLAGAACFALFSAVTLYKGVTGAASCGCFGSVHINPWVTLFVVDLPAVVLLAIFRPKFDTRRLLNLLHWLEPLPRPTFFVTVFVLGLSAIAVSFPVLILNQPAKVTANYEILEPEAWIGKELPILEHIDIADQLKTGNWLVLLYHHDCPNCAEAIPRIKKMARDLKGNEEFMQIALITVPPYAVESDLFSQDNSCVLGKLNTSKEWFVTTPAIVHIRNIIVQSCWQKRVPSIDELENSYFQTNLTFSDGTLINENREGGVCHENYLSRIV